MKVAVIQFCPTLRDVPGNLRKLALLVVKAARNGAKLIVCPELALSGYSLDRASAEECAEVVSEFKPGGVQGLSMDTFYRIAHQYTSHIVWGLVEKSEATGNLFNSQVMMCPDGAFETYSKLNLFSADYLWATKGSASPPVRRVSVEGRSYKVGLLICRDVRDRSDKIDSFYGPGDADVVCLSSAWGRGAFPATAWMDFAKNNQVCLAVSNRYGMEVPNDFGFGGICIISDRGSVSCEGLVWGQPCIVYGEV